jgi:hypothetical protein
MAIIKLYRLPILRRLPHLACAPRVLLDEAVRKRGAGC